MATRSCIGIKHGDVIKSVYCHWDGYINCNGRILFEAYQNSAKVNKLISLGDLSVLGIEIGEEHNFDSRVNEDWCTFYGRDRGEKDTEFKTFQTEDEFVDWYSDAEYYYLYDNGVWYVKSYKSEFKPLHEEIEKLDAEVVRV